MYKIMNRWINGYWYRCILVYWFIYIFTIYAHIYIYIYTHDIPMNSMVYSQFRPMLFFMSSFLWILRLSDFWDFWMSQVEQINKYKHLGLCKWSSGGLASWMDFIQPILCGENFSQTGRCFLSNKAMTKIKFATYFLQPTVPSKLTATSLCK